MLHFRDLGASFSRFGYFVFEIWVLRASVLVFETTIYLTYILYGICVNVFIMNWYISKRATQGARILYTEREQL